MAFGNGGLNKHFSVGAKQMGDPHRACAAALTNLGSSRELYKTGLPRGALLARLMADRERMSYWVAPGALMRHRFALAQIIIGKLGKTYLSHLDDRPMVTIAGERGQS